MEAGAILLSGGKSSRMGTNKALLTINEKPTIERIRDELKKEFAEIILVSNEPETYQFLKMKTVTDQYPDQGPLAGIHAGLKASSFEVNLAAACDMPFVSAGLAAALVEHLKQFDAVVPVINGKQHPLFAVYHKRIAPVIETCIANHSLRMKHLLDQLQVFYLSEKDLHGYCQGDLDRIFFNMNHPEEYENAKKWAETGN